MVKHIVVYKFKDDVNHAEAIEIIRNSLVPLVGQIPGLMHMEVNLCFQGMDYALYSEFDSRESLEKYAVHPLHLAAKDNFSHVIASRVAADYEL